MAESLWWVMQQMCPLRENRKIILIITDGEPDSIPAAQEAFKQAQKKGFECYGLGIMCSSIATLLPHTSRVIETLPQCELSRKLRISVTRLENSQDHFFPFGTVLAFNVSSKEKAWAKGRGACRK